MADLYQKLVNALTKSSKYFDVVDRFQKLKTDQDRVIFTLNIMWDNNVIPYAASRPKDAEESEKIRECGNNLFVACISNEDFFIVLNTYTRSITLAPYPSRQLALAYANRSAVLFELGLYSECIEDIDRALSFNYPNDLKGKLYVRKAECLDMLGSRTVKYMIKKTEYCINKMAPGPNKLKLQTKLDGLCQKIQQKNVQCNPVKRKSESEFPLPLIKSYNNEVPCASDAVALKYDKDNGRHVVATRNIDVGEVIVVEKPYSLLLSQVNMLTHCSNCLKVCWATIPCKYCTYAMYCSEECRNIEWSKSHDIECAIFPTMLERNFSNSDLLSLRLVLLAVREAGNIHGLKTMLKEADKSDDPRTIGFSLDGKIHSDKYISLYSLERNTKKRSFLDLFTRSVDTCFILYLLARYTEFFGITFSEDLRVLAKNDDVTFLGGLILRHQQIIPTNIHSFNEERYLEYEHAERGLAAMPFCSLFNHSCSPNITRISRPQHIIMYTLYPIRKGEQLLDNYGYHFAVMPKIPRQEQILRYYYFTCSCVPCQENWPLFVEFKSYETLAKIKDDKKTIKNALRKFNMYVDLARKGDVLDKPHIIQDLLMMIRVLYDRVPIVCKEMSDVIETLKRVTRLHGNINILPEMPKRKK